MNDRRSFKQSDAARALRAAMAAGLTPRGYTIGPDGSISVQLGPEGELSQNTFDKLLERSK
jgi:hypothetical protein